LLQGKEIEGNCFGIYHNLVLFRCHNRVVTAAPNALNRSKHFVFYDTTFLSSIIKTASMENSKNLELEILITVRQNRKVPANDFHKLFEHNWNFYNSKFNQLITEGLFMPVRIADLPVYQLTSRGKTRIAELLEQREREITLRLLHLRQLSQSPARGGKSAMAVLNSIIHFWISSQKIAESKPQIANEA
jgi:hypothetical protein